MDLGFILAILGVIVGIFSLYYTRKQTRITVNQASATDKSISISHEDQIHERFTHAINQLGAVDKEGNPAIEIRLGGIYALERIANESEKDYWPIMEILTAYVRKNSRLDNHVNENTKCEVSELVMLSLDIQTIISIFERREYSFSDKEPNNLNLQRTDFQNTDLSKVNLIGVDLSKANFKSASLERANLINSDLDWANLVGANLKQAIIVETSFHEADFRGAYLYGAIFKRDNLNIADLSKANLSFAIFEETIFERANLEGANLPFATFSVAFLSNVNLSGAHLEGADLEGANFEEANLQGADLRMTNLQGTKNLTIDQLSKAKTLYKTQLDEGLEAELRAKGFGHLIDEPEK